LSLVAVAVAVLVEAVVEEVTKQQQVFRYRLKDIQ
jgi:hypothetical protein